MKTRPLGHTGLRITEIGLGGWGLGGVYYGKVPPGQGVEAVEAYLDSGGNHLDTAYSYHGSEEIIGEALRGRDRSRLVIASKTYAGSESDEEIPDIRKHLEVSLRDLGTDYIDLYYLHGSPEDPDRMHRLIDAFEELRSEGKIRAIGASIRGPVIDGRSLATAMQYVRSGRIEVVELAYSVLRQTHRPAIEEAHRLGVGVVARIVLESGLLSGRYPVGHRFDWPDQRSRYRDEIDLVLAEADELRRLLPPGYSAPSELATAFVLANPGVSGAILGGTTAEQYRETCAMDRLAPLPTSLVRLLEARYAALNDTFNPTGSLVHVDSPRRPIEVVQP